jgi:hypothetical protein
MATYTGGAASISHTANNRVSLGVATATVPMNVSSSLTFGPGTGANQANVSGSATITPGGVDVDLDLSGGSTLNDGDGGATTFTAVKAFTVKAAAANAGAVEVDTTLTNGWVAAIGGVISLAPGATVSLQNASAAGWAVAAGTGDLVRFSGTGTDSVAVVVTGLS